MNFTKLEIVAWLLFKNPQTNSWPEGRGLYEYNKRKHVKTGGKYMIMQSVKRLYNKQAEPCRQIFIRIEFEVCQD